MATLLGTTCEELMVKPNREVVLTVRDRPVAGPGEVRGRVRVASLCDGDCR